MISTGVARVCADPGLLGDGWRAARYGLVTNHGGLLPDLTPSAMALRAAGVPIVALFGPEHGLHGTAQAGQSESSTVDPDTGLALFDTYEAGPDALDEMVSAVDVLLFDLPDIGARCYTYVWTMADLLAAAARTGRRAVVLDRPNPIGGVAVEGPPLDPAFASFVGRAAIPLRHALTIGELARWLARDRRIDLAVVAMTGWQRRQYADGSGLPWVMPSVNLPTLDTALVYPGTVLFEGTNVSEGRGTTRPFELIGAPYVDGRWAAALRAASLPGVLFRDVRFRPAYGRHANTTARGVQLHVVDRDAFAPVRTALEMLRLLRALYPVDFGWRLPEPGRRQLRAASGRSGDRSGSGRGVRRAEPEWSEEPTVKRPESGGYFVDLLWGSDSLRQEVDADRDPARLLDKAPTGADWAGDVLLYA